MIWFIRKLLSVIFGVHFCDWSPWKVTHMLRVHRIGTNDCVAYGKVLERSCTVCSNVQLKRVMVRAVRDPYTIAD